MTTTPLRPDLAHRAMLGRWLHVHAEVIAQPWISSVLARRVYRPEQSNSCLTETGLRALYDSLANALETRALCSPGRRDLRRSRVTVTCAAIR